MARRDRVIFPEREDVNGNKINALSQGGVPDPELPDVGVGDRLADLGLHVADVSGKRLCRHFAPEQHLIANDHRLDCVGEALGQRDACLDLPFRAIAPVRHPEPKEHFESVTLCDCRHLVETDIDRVDANAIGQLGEARQIVVDLSGIDTRTEIERRLLIAERRIRDALQPLALRQRRRRHRNWSSQPPPKRRDNCCDGDERTESSLHPLTIIPHTPCRRARVA